MMLFSVNEFLIGVVVATLVLSNQTKTTGTVLERCYKMMMMMTMKN